MTAVSVIHDEILLMRNYYNQKYRNDKQICQRKDASFWILFDPECLFSKLKISNSTHNEEEKKDKEK